jgi:hypothetical protein
MPFEVVLDTTLARVTLVPGKGAVGTWRSEYGQQRKSEEARFQDELGGKPECVGVYASERLSFRHLGKASRGKPRRKPESGKPTFRDCREAGGNVTLSFIARCARLGYPNHVRLCERLGAKFPGPTRRSAGDMPIKRACRQCLIS